MGKIKTFIEDHIVDIVCITAFIFFVLGSWLLYTASRTEHEYQHVHESVDRAEAGIDRAGKRLDSAQTEIKNAEVHIQRANEATGKLTDRTKRDAEELDECQRITDRMSERSERIQRIIADVESANPSNGT